VSLDTPWKDIPKDKQKKLLHGLDGEKLKVTERVRKLGAKTLEILATVDDPEMYSKPWTARYTFTLYPDERIQQYVCGLDAIKSRFGTTGKMPTFKHLGS